MRRHLFTLAAALSLALCAAILWLRSWSYGRYHLLPDVRVPGLGRWDLSLSSAGLRAAESHRREAFAAYAARRNDLLARFQGAGERQGELSRMIDEARDADTPPDVIAGLRARRDEVGRDAVAAAATINVMTPPPGVYEAYREACLGDHF